jgi:hypothetical protein
MKNRGALEQEIVLKTDQMTVRNNKLGKFFGPSSSYTGYVFIACGIFTSTYSLLALTLLIPGFFLAYTYNGTIIDCDKRRIKPYTALFGIFKTGKWIDADQFSRFSIIKATRKYTSYSRANVRFDMNVSDIELLVINRNGSKKTVLNKYSDFEDAHKEMEELSQLLLPEKVLPNQ